MESGGSESERATHDRAKILPAKAVPSSAILKRGIVLSDQDRCRLDELEMIGRVQLASRLFSAPSPPNALLTRFGSIPRIQSRTLLHVPTITRFFRPMVSMYAATHLKPVLSAPCAVGGWRGLETNPV